MRFGGLRDARLAAVTPRDVAVKIIGVLRTHLAKNAFSATLPEGGTVQDPILRYWLPSDGIIAIIVDGQQGLAGTLPAYGDSVTFFILVTGG